MFYTIWRLFFVTFTFFSFVHKITIICLLYHPVQTVHLRHFTREKLRDGVFLLMLRDDLLRYILIMNETIDFNVQCFGLCVTAVDFILEK